MLSALLVAMLLQAAPMFPYVPTHNAPANITNVSTWPSWEKGKAGDSGFIQSVDDHFVDGTGAQRRFLGTNICFTGCFPTHEDADRVSAELARYGINLVRLHYVHHRLPKERAYPKPNSFLEPEQLERFDYLFSKLKEHGIYIYFQLNISRKFGEVNGIVNAKQLPHFYHGVDNFDYQFLALQKNFITEILAHVNPYTGLAYKDEPAIGMLEPANENTITYAWFTPRYRFPNLVEPYMSEFKTMWNSWLKDRYSSTAELKEAWMSGFEGDGTEFFPDGVLSENYDKTNWMLQLDGKAEGFISLEPAAPKDKLKGTHYMRAVVTKKGATPNMPQFCKGPIAVKSMAPYTLKLKMRADKNIAVDMRLSQSHAPWQVAGLTVTGIQLTKKWQEFTFPFVANMDDEAVRLVVCSFEPGTYEFADLSLTSGATVEWPKEWSLEEGNIPIPTRAQWSMPPQRAVDFTAFLSHLEDLYFGQMYSHVKVGAGARQPVTGTQILWGFSQPHSRTDYIDLHSYYNHPIFPNTLKDYHNWSMGSGALVNEMGKNNENRLSSDARARILGRPLTISEYDHPNLSYWAAEGNVIGSAIGAFQNWSGILQFAWSHSDNFFRDVMDSRFDMCSAPQKLAHLPACYSMFVRGDVQTGSADTLVARLARIEDDIKTVAITQGPSAHNRAPSRGLMETLPVMMRSGTVIMENEGQFPLEGHTVITKEEEVPQHWKDAYEARKMITSTGELTWDWQEKGAGFFKVDTDYTKAFTGFVHGRSFEYKGLTLTPGETQKDWLTLTLTCKAPGKLQPGGKLAKGCWLLAVTGQCRNTDEVIVTLAQGKRISASEADGGKVGVAPILCEGVPAQLRLKGLAGRVQFFALDVDGFRKTMIPVTADGGDALLQTGPDYQTFWYEIVVK